MTALELIADRSITANNAAYARRDKAPLGHRIDMQSYHEGEACAYNDAHKIVKRELERLRNLWQNGAITYSDFTGV